MRRAWEAPDGIIGASISADAGGGSAGGLDSDVGVVDPAAVHDAPVLTASARGGCGISLLVFLVFLISLSPLQ